MVCFRYRFAGFFFVVIKSTGRVDFSVFRTSEMEEEMFTKDTRTIGGRIRVLRETRGIGQKELAKEFFLANKSVVSAYEREERAIPIDVLLKYSEKFNVSTDWILKGVSRDKISFAEEDEEADEFQKIFIMLKSVQLKEVAMAQLKALALLDNYD